MADRFEGVTASREVEKPAAQSKKKSVKTKAKSVVQKTGMPQQGADKEAAEDKGPPESFQGIGDPPTPQDVKQDASKQGKDQDYPEETTTEGAESASRSDGLQADDADAALDSPKKASPKADDEDAAHKKVEGESAYRKLKALGKSAISGRGQRQQQRRSQVYKPDLDEEQQVDFKKKMASGSVDEVAKTLKVSLKTRVDGKGAMYWAAVKGRDVMEKLVELVKQDDEFFGDKEKIVNVLDTGTGRCDLHYAAAEGLLEAVKLLVEHKADVNLTQNDENGFCALHFAAQGGHVKVVEELLEHSVHVDVSGKRGWTPLHFAAIANDGVATVKALIHAEADPMFGASRGGADMETAPIGLALSIGTEAVVQAFLENNSKVALAVFCAVITNNGDDAEGYLKELLKDAKTSPEQATLRTVINGMRAFLAMPAKDSNGCKVVEYEEIIYNASWSRFWKRQVVPVELKVLPGLTGTDAWDDKMLRSIAESPNNSALQTDAVQAVISVAWQRWRLHTALDVAYAVLKLACLVYASYGYRHAQARSDDEDQVEAHAGSRACLIVAAILHLKKTLEELWQYGEAICQWEGRRSFWAWRPELPEMDFDNFADLIYLIVGWLAFVRQLGEHELEKPWMSCWCAMAWLRVMNVSCGESWLGARLLPILYTMRDTLNFVIVSGVYFAAAVHAYYNLRLREQPSPLYAALVQVVRLGMLGDFDMYEFEGLDPHYAPSEDQQKWDPVDPEPGPDYVVVHILFYFIALFITILLMNIQIGILGHSFDTYSDIKIALCMRTRAKMLLRVNHRPWSYVRQFFSYELLQLRVIDIIRALQLHSCTERWPMAGSFLRCCLWLLIALVALPFVLILLLLLLCLVIVCPFLLILFRSEGMLHTIRYGILPDFIADECCIFLLKKTSRKEKDESKIQEQLMSKQKEMDTKIDKIMKSLNIEADQKQEAASSLGRTPSYWESAKDHGPAQPCQR